jgi:hypothetical protein
MKAPTSVAVALAAALALVGCNDEPGFQPPDPGVGTLQVTTVTTGDNPDGDGYSVVLDGNVARAIGINDTQNLQNLTVGTYVVELSGLAANCLVGVTNAREVEIRKDETTATAFDVSCPTPQT